MFWTTSNWCLYYQSKKALTAPIFVNIRNFETQRDATKQHEIKSLDFQEIYQFDLSFFVVSLFVPKYRSLFKLERSILFG